MQTVAKRSDNHDLNNLGLKSDKVKREVTITADGVVNIEAAIEPPQDSSDFKESMQLRWQIAKDLLENARVLKMDPLAVNKKLLSL